MKNRRLLFNILSFALVSVFLVACKRTDLSKIASGALSPSYAVPLGKATFGVYEVLTSEDSTSILQVGPDGAIKLAYETELGLLGASDMLAIAGQEFELNQTAAQFGFSTSVMYTATTSQNFNETFQFTNVQGYALTSVDFLSGNLKIDVSTTLQHNVTIDLTFPDFTVNGVPITRTLQMNNPPAPQSATQTIDFTNALLDLASGAQGNNEIRMEGTITVQGTGNTLLGSESIAINAEFIAPQFNVARGNIGNLDPFALKDTINIDLFKNFNQGEVAFTNPSIRFDVINSFGIPMEINFPVIKTVETNSGNEASLIGYPLEFPIEAAATPGQSPMSTLILNSTNTQNLNSIISPTPKKLVYEVDGELNPNGTTQNFIAHNSSLTFRAELDLPLEGYAKNFKITDTIDFNFDVQEQDVRLAFRMISENGFPIEIGADILVADENYKILGDINPGNDVLIKGAQVDNTGRAIGKEKNIVDIVLDASQSSFLRKGKYLILTVSGQTTDGNLNKVVKFYNDYELDLKLAVKVDGKITL